MIPGELISGSLLLILGRKLFWLYVAAVGFAAGFTISSQLFHVHQEWLVLVIGVVFGLAGALLAYFAEKIAIGVAGFLAGVYISIILTGNFGVTDQLLTLVIYLVAGIIGAVLMYFIFDWALILLSSLAGALLLREGLRLNGLVGWIVAIALFFLGIIIQINIEAPPSKSRATSN